jgi:hypothetical protein
MNTPTPPCENCRQPHGYHQFIKLQDRDEIDILWFCSNWCKNHFTCDDTSSNREFMPTGGFA